jgi:hypothetical protein
MKLNWSDLKFPAINLLTYPRGNMKLDKLTARKLKTLVIYDPDSGLFYRRGANCLATNQRPDGYLSVYITGKHYELAHRLAVLYMTGEYPEGEVDHINGLKSDNRWDNLRVVTKANNQWNSKIRKDNSSGVKGVSWIERDKAWVARIQVNGKRLTIGYFKTLEEAQEAIAEARVTYHGSFGNRG